MSVEKDVSNRFHDGFQAEAVALPRLSFTTTTFSSALMLFLKIKSRDAVWNGAILLDPFVVLTTVPPPIRFQAFQIFGEINVKLRYNVLLPSLRYNQ